MMANRSSSIDGGHSAPKFYERLREIPKFNERLREIDTSPARQSCKNHLFLQAIVITAILEGSSVLDVESEITHSLKKKKLEPIQSTSASFCLYRAS
jgi:hypothetical protein